MPAKISTANRQRVASSKLFLCVVQAGTRLGLRREAQRHAAFRPGEKSTEARQSFVRAKAVSPLPLCHRTPRRGSNLEPA